MFKIENGTNPGTAGRAGVPLEQWFSVFAASPLILHLLYA